MQSVTSRQRDPLQVFSTQQRFSFGKSSEDFYARRRYRAAWISDTHLGTRGCNATALLDFLRETDFDTLYIVGDLIDICRCGARFTGHSNTMTSSKKFCAKPARERV